MFHFCIYLLFQIHLKRDWFHRRFVLPSSISISTFLSQTKVSRVFCPARISASKQFSTKSTRKNKIENNLIMCSNAMLQQEMLDLGLVGKFDNEFN